MEYLVGGKMCFIPVTYTLNLLIRFVRRLSPTGTRA